MKELIRVSVQYASRQQCCKTHKRPLPFTFIYVYVRYLIVSVSFFLHGGLWQWLVFILCIWSSFRIISYAWIILFRCLFPLTFHSFLYLVLVVYCDNLYLTFLCIICIISFLLSYKPLSCLYMHSQI